MKLNVDPNAVYSITELAAECDVAYNTARAWVRDGLRARKTGKNTYVTGRAVLDFFSDDNIERPQYDELDPRLAKKLQRVL